ncbi:phage minor head protein [Nocardia abscessus]|uniref:phage minor head protein n=1 Tax=Nocardia abscessus TaxID=120957 RepID=UPI002458A303|nr:phage minor head protein [Nocardia abscessus]
MNQEQRNDLLAILALERELAAAAGAALRPWLADARAAALPALVAAAIPPDPDAIGRTADAAWTRELDARFLPRITAAVTRLLGDSAERLSEWRTGYVASVRTRLAELPARAARRVRAAVDAAAGQTVDVVRGAVEQALSWASWRDDAALIGRNEAVAAFNAARLAAAEQHARETGVRLDKQWISLHDSKTRHSHMDADRQRVALDSKFVVGAALLDFPHDPTGPPEEVINCRCWIQILNAAPLEPVVAASAAQPGGTTMPGKRFEALLMPTGVIGRSGQGMLSTSVELVDTALPLALKWQKHDLPAHEGGLTIGAIQELELRDGGLWATGTLLDGPETDEALLQVEAGVTRPSAELVVRSQVLADAAGNTVSLETAEQLYAEGLPIVMRWDTVEIVAGTLVSVPEFRDTVITVGEATEAAPPLGGGGGAGPPPRPPRP